MYEKFYGLSEKPFTLLPDPSFLYMGKKHSIAYSMLEYGILNQAGFTVITGEIGSGKTTLIRHLLNQMHEEITVGLVSNTHQDMGKLLQWILLAFDQEYREREPVVLYDAFTKYLIEQYANNKRTVLILDEAQNLTPHVLEELRMLSNINADKHQVLQLILIGQPQLYDLLKEPELLQFRQRVSVDYHLSALSELETLKYISHRTVHAGGESALFTEDSSCLIHQASKGIPRVINILCDTALVYGFAEQKRCIDSVLVKSVIRDKVGSGLIQLEAPIIDEKPFSSMPDQEQVVKKRKVAKFDMEMAKLLFGKQHNNS